jgi:hypothetical protein
MDEFLILTAIHTWWAYLPKEALNPYCQSVAHESVKICLTNSLLLKPTLIVVYPADINLHRAQRFFTLPVTTF